MQPSYVERANDGAGRTESQTGLPVIGDDIVRGDMKFLWNKARASQGGNSADLLGDTPFENDLRLGKHHLKLVDGEWVLLSSSAGASDAPNMGAVLEENQRLKAQVADLERANHRLTFKNKLLIAMCTISEGDRRVAEMENEQLLKDAGKAPPAHKP